MIEVQARDAISGGITQTLIDPSRLGEFILGNAPNVTSYNIEDYGLISVVLTTGKPFFIIWIDNAAYVLNSDDIIQLKFF